jgi:sugar lactone lactonase YvrE
MRTILRADSQLAKSSHIISWIFLTLCVNLVLAISIVNPVAAGTPSFSYSTPQVLTTGTAVSISPAVTSGWFGTPTNFASITNPDACYYSPATGDIYATSASTNDVYIYNSSGSLLFTGSGSTYSYSYPEGIVTDGSGSTYVASHNNSTIKKLTTGGTETSITGVTSPIGLVFDSSGNLYVTDQSTGDVYKVTPGSTAATVFLTGFNSPWGIALDANGDMFVSEVGNNDIIEIANATSGGATKTTFATGFNSPRCLAFDSAGNLFVADCGNSAIKEISPGGTVTTVISSSSYSTVVGLSFDASNDLYVSSYGNSVIYKFVPITYSISATLPAGLSFNSYTGIISGTPTGVSSATTYTITANNGTNSNTTTINITIDPSTPIISGGGAGCGAGSVVLTASGSAPSGGAYNWFNSSTGSAIASGNTLSPIVSGTYYVSYTVSGLTSAQASVSVTINPIVSSPFSNALFEYPFSGNANDISGNNNTGYPTYTNPSTGPPTLSADRFGAANSAYTFDGVGQYIYTTTQYTNPQIFSLSLWFKTSTTSGGKLIGFDTNDAGPGSGQFDRHIYMNNSGQLYFGVYSSATLTINSTKSYNDGVWHHVVVTFGPTYGAVMYVDGSSVASNSAMTAAETDNGYWRIGGDNLSGWPSTHTSNYFAGQIDDIGVYTLELTAAQVASANNLNLIGSSSTAVCAGNSVTFIAPTITGATYSWTDGTNTVTGNPATFTSASSGNYTLTVTGGPGGCSSTATVAPPPGPVYTWTAAAGTTNPTTAANWTYTTTNTAGVAPSFNGTENITIPGGLSYYPSLTANESIASLNLASGASLTLNGYTLSVGCNIYNSSGGQILYGSNAASGLTWNGSVAAQSYVGGNTTNTAELANMTVNNSAGGTVTISGGPVDVYNTLTLTKGNLVVSSSPAALTLKSTATQTAGVAAIPTGYSITGSVTCERYIDGGVGYRGYRLLSSPVYAATVSSNNIYSLNYLQNSIYLTGNASGGFDKTGNPTIYLYREDQVPSNASFTSGNFWGISAINNSPTYNYYLNNNVTSYNIPVGNGYMVFFRGNRASAALATETSTSYTTPVTATLSTTGSLNQGTFLVRNWYNPTSGNIGYTGTGTSTTTTNYSVRGFNLVGNPYASSIDWSTFSNTVTTAPIYGANVSPSIWVFNPKTKQYDTYNAKTGVATGSASKIIASGEGFFVQATASYPALTFNESAKSSSQPATLELARRVTVSALAAGTYNSFLHLKVITDTVNQSDMVIGLNPTSATTYNAEEDAKFIQGSGNLQLIAGMSSDSVYTSVKWLPLNQRLTVPLRVVVNTSGQYTIQRTDFNAIPKIYNVWLMDYYKKDSLDIRANTTYTFDVDDNDTATYGKHRFAVVLSQNPALSVHLLSFSGSKTTGGSQLNWTTENEDDYTSFTLERSSDGGTTFTGLESFQSSNIGAYSFLDKTPPATADMYRLKITDLNGSITYSNIITIMYGNTGSLAKTDVSVYPNPAKATLNLNISPGLNSTAATPARAQTPAYNVQITSILGTVVRKATITSQSWQTDVSNLMPGTYVIEVVSQLDNSVVGEQKFIKL